MDGCQIPVALIGVGRWGQVLAKSLPDDLGLAAVCDLDSERGTAVAERYGVDWYLDLQDAIADVEAVLVAVPASQHFAVACQVIEAGKHVFVEKPAATSIGQCRTYQELLIPGQILQVGHEWVYDENVRWLIRCVQTGELGEIRYILGRWLNWGIVREDVDAFWNLAMHPVSILVEMFPDLAIDWRACVGDGIAVLTGCGEPVVDIVMGWYHQRKVRQLLVVGTEKAASWDDLSPYQLRVMEYGDMETRTPVLQQEYTTVEAELRAFARAIRSGSEPRTGITHLTKVTAILEVACAQV